MKRRYTVIFSVLAGIGVGAAAVQGLHAQAKPPAYVVIPILKINDTAAFKAGVLDKGSEIAASLKAEDGHLVIRSEEFTRRSA